MEDKEDGDRSAAMNISAGTIASSLKADVTTRILAALDAEWSANLTSTLESIIGTVRVDEARQLNERLHDVSLELASLQTRFDLLSAKHEGLKHENAIQRRSLEALAPILKLEDSPTHETQAQTSTTTIPYATYEAAVQQNRLLREQLQECNNLRKNEATARYMLIRRVRQSKESIQRWEEFSQRWQKWREKRDSHSASNQAQTPFTELDNQYKVLPTFQDLDATLQRDGEKLGLAKLLQVDKDRAVVSPASALNTRNTFVPQLQAQSSSEPPPTTRPHNTIAASSTEEAHSALLSYNQEERPAGLAKHALYPSSKATRQDRPSDSSDVQITRSRRVKRRQDQSRLRASASHLHIKREHSSPTSSMYLAQYRPDSLDLDDVGGVVDTPRKRRRLQILHATRRIRRQTLRNERSMSEPPMDTQALEQSLIGTEMLTSHQTLVPKVRPALASIESNLVDQMRNRNAVTVEAPSAPVESVGKTSLSRKDKRFKQIVDEDEDEDEVVIDQENPPRIRSMSAKIARSNAQLAALLNLPAPNPKRTPKQKQQATKSIDPRAIARVNGPIKQRLRDTPLESLTLGDFKLNNYFDHGGSTEGNPTRVRQCRPGCTDSRCCGEAMRAIAKSMPFLKLTRPPLTSSPESRALSDDEYLIKWHLGSSWSRGRVQDLPTAKYDELLLTARTALLAERYGRHKEEHEKRLTPPGYWQMSMPSTQELSLQHHEAADIEAGLIRDRWTEARKRAGRWRFIDE